MAVVVEVHSCGEDVEGRTEVDYGPCGYEWCLISRSNEVLQVVIAG